MLRSTVNFTRSDQESQAFTKRSPLPNTKMNVSLMQESLRTEAGREGGANSERGEVVGGNRSSSPDFSRPSLTDLSRSPSVSAALAPTPESTRIIRTALMSATYDSRGL